MPVSVSACVRGVGECASESVLAQWVVDRSIRECCSSEGQRKCILHTHMQFTHTHTNERTNLHTRAHIYAHTRRHVYTPHAHTSHTHHNTVNRGSLLSRKRLTWSARISGQHCFARVRMYPCTCLNVGVCGWLGFAQTTIAPPLARPGTGNCGTHGEQGAGCHASSVYITMAKFYTTHMHTCRVRTCTLDY